MGLRDDRVRVSRILRPDSEFDDAAALREPLLGRSDTSFACASGCFISANTYTLKRRQSQEREALRALWQSSTTRAPTSR